LEEEAGEDLMEHDGRFILEGHTPVPEPDRFKWGLWMETAVRRVALTTTENGEVSTVFLGLDYSFGEPGGPILFETRVFGGELDQEMDRYRTWEEAEAGHREFVSRIQPEPMIRLVK
jgi:hypothetical protein